MSEEKKKSTLTFHGVLIYSLVIIILSTNVLVVRADDDEQYEPSDDICDKCNCTNVEGTLEDGESGILFTIDCSMKSYQHLFAKWPEAMGDNHRDMELIYIMSFNNLHHLQQFPSTEATVFLTLRHNKISTISNEAFIDAKNIVFLDLSFNKLSSEAFNPDIFRGPHNDDEYSPIMLETLDLSHNSINYLDKLLFEHTPHLKKLDLSYNEFKTLEEGTQLAIGSLHNLEILIMNNIGIMELPVNILENKKNLREIFLNGNDFLSVPDLSLVGESLEYLHLSDNNIEMMNSESFSGLSKLEQLNISNLPQLETIDAGTFSHLTTLEVLVCKGNKKLSSIFMDGLLDLVHLKELDLSNNKLTTVNFREFEEIDKDEEKVEHFQHLHTLRLAGNPWNCDCKLIKALEYFNRNASYFKKTANNDEARCATPYDLLSKLLYELPLNYICIADHKVKPMKIPIYDPPQFLRPKSIMLTVFSVVVVVVVGVIIGFLVVCIKRRLKSNEGSDNSNPIRYTAVRDSTVSNIVNVPYQQP